MPYDPASTNKPTLNGRPITIWTAEDPLAGGNNNSPQWTIPRNITSPNCLSVSVQFSANPGAFQLDLQVADVDEDKYYVSKASLTTGLNGTFVGRIEAINIVARFGRLRLVSRTNAGTVSATVC